MHYGFVYNENNYSNKMLIFRFKTFWEFLLPTLEQVLTDQVKNLIQSLCQHLHTVSNTFDLSKQMSVKQLNGDLRALVLVQAGVKEIDKEQLKESVMTLKQRTKVQLKDLSEEIEKSEVKECKNNEGKSDSKCDVKNEAKSEGDSEDKKGIRQSRESNDSRSQLGSDGKGNFRISEKFF